MSKDPSSVELRVDELERQLDAVFRQRERYGRALIAIENYRPEGNTGLATQVAQLKLIARKALER